MKGKARRSSEFDRIARYFAPLAASFPGAFGLKDDAAVIAPTSGAEFVITTDTIVAGVHYIGDEPPALIAAKLLRVNLSDLAAMGARPRGYTLNVALPNDIDDSWLEGFAEGLADDQEHFDISLIGGDSVSTLGPSVFTLTAIGEVPVGSAVRRAGAVPGDIIFVSGTIGDAALGLRAVRDRLKILSKSDCAALVERYRRPRPRVNLGQRLSGLAHAAADISDGLVADLGHIASASGMAAMIRAESVPLSPPARAALAVDPALLEVILSGGDDYELIFCVPPDEVDAVQAMAREIELPLTALGDIRDGDGVAVLDAAGNPIVLSSTGFRHG
jgi:thiamine-monophosphate kinase